MEAVVVALRPQQHATITSDFNPAAYDILLTDVRLANSDKSYGSTLKQLPKMRISYEVEPAEALFSFLYGLTGHEHGGLKGKRAIFISPDKNDSVSDNYSDAYSKGTLYCIPIDSRDKLNPKVVENAPNMPGFYSLSQVMNALNSNAYTYSKQTRQMLHTLESWLREKHKTPGLVAVLFSVPVETRLRNTVTNPAYYTESVPRHVQRYGSTSDLYTTRSVANEALAKMLSIEKCEITIINPLFGTGLPYKNKVETNVVNRFWGMGKPDYSKVTMPSGGKHGVKSSPSWLEEFPLHKCAHEGDSKGILELLGQGHGVDTRDHESWAPVHYAAWNGHMQAITTLLTIGNCSPNVANDHGSTPLHLATANGRQYVTELLLNHADIDVNAVDNDGKTALNLCQGSEDPNRMACAKLLITAAEKAGPELQVFLMDGTHRMLKLVSGANTTVQQIHQQMMKELELPTSCGHLFTIWICSRNLQLQLKPDHKPIQHLNDWRRKIVGMLTDEDPAREDPQLFWRRDAILSIEEERKVAVKHREAINLLFHEAYHNYIKSLYTCADLDAINLGSILMQLNQGDYDPRKAQTFFANERGLQTLVPVAKLRIRTIDWTSLIQSKYQQYSGSLSNMDRSPPVLQQHFLALCWNLVVYGSAFFTGQIQIKSTKIKDTVYIGVNDIGVHIVHGHHKAMLKSFNYKSIDWETKEPRNKVLEIRQKGTTKGNISIFTRQAGLIHHLMTKLAQINLAGTTQTQS